MRSTPARDRPTHRRHRHPRVDLGVLLVALVALAPLGPASATVTPEHRPAVGSVRAEVRAGARAPDSTPQPAPASGAAWRWPTAAEPQVLRRFSAPAQRWSPGHRGVDLGAVAGEPVLAPVAGVVVFVGIVVDRPVVSVLAADGLRTSLEPVVASIPVGEAVSAGDVIGVVAPGVGHCAAADCLHWGVRRGPDAYLDPLVLVGAVPGPPVLLSLTGSRAGLRAPGTQRSL